uniref:Uncharacterized protein n=1 Tax=Panagrellus redivivus TaxID=6233 RepID=A0A7E4UMA1_PANRE
MQKEKVRLSTKDVAVLYQTKPMGLGWSDNRENAHTHRKTKTSLASCNITSNLILMAAMLVMWTSKYVKIPVIITAFFKVSKRRITSAPHSIFTHSVKTLASTPPTISLWVKNANASSWK